MGAWRCASCTQVGVCATVLTAWSDAVQPHGGFTCEAAQEFHRFCKGGKVALQTGAGASLAPFSKSLAPAQWLAPPCDF